MASLGVTWVIALLTTVGAQAGVIDPRLEATLRGAAPGDDLAVIVRFAGGVDVRDRELRDALESLQARKTVVLWIAHGIAATVPARAIPELAGLPGVEHIRLDDPVPLPPRSGNAESVHTATALRETAAPNDPSGPEVPS